MTSLQTSGKTILIVDDILENLDLLSQTLTAEGYEVRCAKNGSLALMSVEHDLPDLILLDVKMPGLSGYEVCRILKDNLKTASIPIIFLSSADDVTEKINAFAIGGVDYITKPFEIREVLARVNTQINLLKTTSELRKLNFELENRVKERTTELENLNQILKSENEQKTKIQEKLLHCAFHDPLTNLPNRTLFIDRVETVIRHSHRFPNYKFAILFIDLDRFKLVNDSLGHQVGDRLLIFCGELFRESVRENDTVARLGGDEFTILLDDITEVTEATQVAQRILFKLTKSSPLINHNFNPTASIGIVLGDHHRQKASDLLRDADIAMYRAKEMGKNRYAIFDRELHQQVMRRLQIESDLKNAIAKWDSNKEDQELKVYYQPIFQLKTRKLMGFESLIRWQHPLEGFISPAEFIPIAEECGLIISIGEWILRESCYQLKQWQNQYPQAKELTISVNFSAKQFENPNLVQIIESILDETQLPGQNLNMEITETVFLLKNVTVIDILSQVKKRGISVSLDDFGTGYSSLSYLHHFPIDILKIDSSFTQQIQQQEKDYEIVRTIVTLGQTLGIKLIAEGIETIEQMDLLYCLGCEFGQGFLVSKPLDNVSAEHTIVQNCELLPIPEFDTKILDLGSY
ncbi:EAL domain-containing response regulator [Geminocystis sp. NIES-3709]|uniref:two-component system response regulator n=1 Tax=Geminocystis sp. NIES-3709 TaxID=1617448 RepID=UPI0005FC494E|nr:EAL domain-containing response regulator [Geminocystis sp. NIES-3709]BAQ65454.1 diguanylate cyclase/phosphodiesterase with PAS/PAC sensor [Geminocystis sp. NIES-3709]